MPLSLMLVASMAWSVPALAQTSAEKTATAAIGELPADLSPWGMFIHADIVVQCVMLGLVLASVITWTIAAVKFLEVYRTSQAVRGQLGVLLRSTSLSDFLGEVTPSGAMADMAAAATTELKLAAGPALNPDGLKERVSWMVERVVAQAGRRISRGTGLLATIGATAPFVGLFGTVWGIMNSFIGISLKHTTNLAVVAPGIAEALLTTALGLAVAIPAVVIYNAFSRSLAAYRALLSDSAAGVLRFVSLELDRQATGYPTRAGSPVVNLKPRP